MNPKEIASVAIRDPLSFGIAYIDLLEDRQWAVHSRAWIKEIYQAVNPWLIERYPEGLARQAAFQKPTQVGLSTFGIVRMLHAAVNWPVRIGYSLPRQQDVIDFVTTRLDPTIQRSELLRSLLRKPDSIHSKAIASAFIFMLEASVEPRMIPLDFVFRDEVDLSDPDNLGMMVNRADASKWKLFYDFSTPTIPNYGINQYYEQSDKRDWFCKCPHCGYWQTMDWTMNLHVEGPTNRPTLVEYVCVKCRKPLTLEDIQHGEWVPEFPERSDQILGYHISQMMTHPAIVLYNSYIDPQQSIKEFYRKRLGIPFAVEGGQIDRDDILSGCFDELYEAEGFSDGTSKYYMGVDQGNELQVMIAKLKRDSRMPEIVHAELVPPSEGFKRIGQLMRLYKIKRAVIDGDPNRHPVRDLQDDFPGKVVIADYAEINNRYTPKRVGKKFITNVVINRTEGFDYLTEGIRDGRYRLFGNPGAPPPIIETVIDHVTALRRDTEERKKPSGSIEVGIWRSLRADHFAHAWLYLATAIDIDTRRGVRVASAENETQDDVDEVLSQYERGQEMLKGIVFHLAEVPVPQLAAWRLHREDEGYEMPFPLSFKMPDVLAEWPEDDVEWAVDHMLAQSALS